MTELNTVEDLNQIEDTETSDSVSNVVTIQANNPTADEMAGICEDITVNYNSKVLTKACVYNFKKNKDKLTGIITERESLHLPIPFPSIDGIVDILQHGGKQLELLVEAVESIINAQVRSLISEDTNLNAGNFPLDKVSWEFISDMPKAQRRGGGIPKEIWDNFALDYVAVMPEATGKTIDQVAKAAKLLVAKLSPVRTNPPVLKLLTEQLAIYADNSNNADEYKECIDFLSEKAEQYLNTSDEELIANL